MNSTPEAPRRMTRVPTRTVQIGRIKGMVQRLGWTDRRYRAFLEDVISRDSIRQASRAEREAFTRFLEAELSSYDARTRHVPEYVSDAEFMAVLA